MSYVIFDEIETTDGINTTVELQFIQLVDGGGMMNTAHRARATEFDTPRAAYAAADRYPQLADWRVGAR